MKRLTCCTAVCTSMECRVSRIDTFSLIVEYLTYFCDIIQGERQIPYPRLVSVLRQFKYPTEHPLGIFHTFRHWCSCNRKLIVHTWKCFFDLLNKTCSFKLYSLVVLKPSKFFCSPILELGIILKLECAPERHCCDCKKIAIWNQTTEISRNKENMRKL